MKLKYLNKRLNIIYNNNLLYCSKKSQKETSVLETRTEAPSQNVLLMVHFSKRCYFLQNSQEGNISEFSTPFILLIKHIYVSVLSLAPSQTHYSNRSKK